ncbi:hypothetical protein KP509_28G005300 [Ceratopteris richardii]|uniref:Protein TIC 100 n=1 Tax=Ceratopteris richardii TaxID=49495 RepID=A0A8T2R965_CERRI|nr:hypothetical protein KP509_28G005300 [Ceratopteris richardii]
MGEEEVQKRVSGLEEKLPGAVEPAEGEDEEILEEFSSEDDFSEYTDSDFEGLDVDLGEEKDGEDDSLEATMQRLEKKIDEEKVADEEQWNFPYDKEHWTEEDLGEHWEDAFEDTKATGWDPNFVSDESWEKYEKLWQEGEPAPPGTPYFVPYRKLYPIIPDDHLDIQTPEDVVEELEREEEFLVWYSYLFLDGSSYEGTVWDDLAHGKGVYTTAMDLIKYEGDWFQNMMQGHGVIEAHTLVDEPLPDTTEAEMAKAEGQILRSDYMDPFDREWLKMDAEEQLEEHGMEMEAWDEKDTWVEIYGDKPEKGKYKYAGQWKHNRFHGCGVYEINGRVIWGKFYFGELLPDPEECSADYSSIHAGLAEVAAAKARMFANKPDGMVRQVKGPFTDPSHPYMYEEEDLWMAPGFINAYYEIPEEWKVYVDEVDKEREMWLNSFYKSPFVVPMPPELEYIWSQPDDYVLLGSSPSALLDLNQENIERASKDLQGEVLLHVPTGAIINWYTNKDGQLQFFYQPITENGEVDLEGIVPIPTGFDEILRKEDEVGKADTKKKRLFQKIRDAWVNTREEYQKDRQSKKQELERKWKQEDEIAEYQRRLRRAERRLALEIDMEKYRAKKMSKSVLEGEFDDSGESLEDQVEQDQEDEVHDLEVSQDEKEEDMKGIEDEESQERTQLEETESQEEVLEDNEEEKKPRSFGKVAMLFIDKEQATRGGKVDAKERDSMLPTAFASLTLGFTIDFGTKLKSKISGLWTRPLYRKARPDVGDRQFDPPQCANSFKPPSSMQVVSHMAKKLNLGMWMGSQWQRPKRHHSIYGTRKQYFMQRWSYRSGQATRRSGGISVYKAMDNLWKRPEIDCLSMAIPVESFQPSS